MMPTNMMTSQREIMTTNTTKKRGWMINMTKMWRRNDDNHSLSIMLMVIGTKMAQNYLIMMIDYNDDRL